MEITFIDKPLVRFKHKVESILEANNKKASDIEYITLTVEEITELGDNIIMLGMDKSPVVRSYPIQGINLFKVKVSANENNS